jgi:hypothetical protein
MSTPNENISRSGASTYVFGEYEGEIFKLNAPFGPIPIEDRIAKHRMCIFKETSYLIASQVLECQGLNVEEEVKWVILLR